MEYRIAADGRSFFTEVDGYLCFMKPIVADGSLLWEWSIQSGGGWTSRGGPDVHRHAHDVETSAEGAQAAMKAWLDAPHRETSTTTRKEL